jgi:hypothetical protein
MSVLPSFAVSLSFCQGISDQVDVWFGRRSAALGLLLEYMQDIDRDGKVSGVNGAVGNRSTISITRVPSAVWRRGRSCPAEPCRVPAQYFGAPLAAWSEGYAEMIQSK